MTDPPFQFKRAEHPEGCVIRGARLSSGAVVGVGRVRLPIPPRIMFRTHCGHCNQTIEFPEELSGSRTECPQCGNPTLLQDDTSKEVRIPRPRIAAPAARESVPESGVQLMADRILDNMESVIVGKRDRMTLLLAAYLAGGHVLLEDVPGVAKTMLARALAGSIGCSFKRIQCTPDLLPGDITGTSVYDPRTSEFHFRKGPVFAQIVLADEINRATPRAQSALLEAMAEGRVTADGADHDLQPPFLVVATQNPIDHEGTFPLPEAQLDRFLVRLSLGYPDAPDEEQLLQRSQTVHPVESLAAVVPFEEVMEAREAVDRVELDEKVARYVVALMRATREHHGLRLGGSPRASLALVRCARAYAAIHGYDFVMPDDIKLLAPHVLGHRLIPSPETRLRRQSIPDLLREIFRHVPVPRLPFAR